MELQGAVCRCPLQQGLGSRIRQLLLQLMQQGRWPLAPMAAGRGHKQILFLPLALEALAAAFEQLLKLAAESAEAGLQARGLQQPVTIKGLLQRDRIAEQLAAAGAALPQVAAGGEQVEVHIRVHAQGLQQLHLDRRQAAEPKQAQGIGQAAGRRRLDLQLGYGLQHLQAEGLHPQALP